MSALVSGPSGTGLSPGGDSWTRHFTVTVPLSTQEYKWVLGNLMLIHGGVEILLVASVRQKPKICADLMGHLDRMQTLPTLALIGPLQDPVTTYGIN